MLVFNVLIYTQSLIEFTASKDHCLKNCFPENLISFTTDI